MSHICRCHALRLPAQVVVHAATVARRQTVRNVLEELRRERIQQVTVGEALALT